MYEKDEHTVALLHFEDGFKDETGKLWTVQNKAAISDEQKKFGGKSLYLDGGSGLSTVKCDDVDFGSEDFTIDMWVYLLKLPPYEQGFLFCSSDSGTNGIRFQIDPDGSLTAPIYVNNSTDLSCPTLKGIKSNVWQHVALIRYQNNLFVSLDGKLSKPASIKGFIAPCGPYGNVVTIGAIFDSRHYINGFVDEFRISKGIARWTADFIPPVDVPISNPISVNLTASAGDSRVTLSWTSVAGATGYNVKRSTITGGPYTTVGTKVSGTNYIDTTVTNSTTYYYVVTSVNADGESINSNEASATAGGVTPPTPTGKSLLRVTMNDSSEREYQLSTAEIEGFVNWFNHYTSTDTKSYMINKTFGKEYLAFDKIISFEVISLMK